MKSRSSDDLTIISFSSSSGSENAELFLSSSTDSDDEQPKQEDNIETTYHVKSKLTRQPSTVEMKNTEGVALTFTPQSCIGRGNHATLFRFAEKSPPPNTEPLTFIVRKPHSDLAHHKTYEGCANFIDLEKRAFKLRRALYPEESPYKFISLNNKIKSTADTDFPFHSNLRIIFPEIKNAQTFEVFIQKNRDYDLLALVILNIITELKRIHTEGVIHGDISSRNILINLDDFSIHFIDFTFAYLTDECATMGFFTTIKEMQEHYFAPERKALEEPIRLRLKPDSKPYVKVKANTAQDIYSLAVMFEDALTDMHKEPDKSQFIHRYLCIIEFIAQGKKNPLERPDLSKLIGELEPLLFMASLKHHLIKLNTKLLIPMLDKFIADYNNQAICQLLLTLCQNEEYHCIKVFADYLCIKKPEDSINSALSLFTHLAKYAKRMTLFTNPIFGSTDRQSLSKEVALAFELADLITHYPQTVCTQTLYEDIQKFSDLEEIFQDLVKDGYVMIAPELSKTALLNANITRNIMP